MLHLTTAQIDAWIAQMIWPFVRIGSCLMVAPAFSVSQVPVRIRLVLALAITGVVAPQVQVPVGIPLVSAGSFMITFQQVVIGVILGLCLQLVFDAVNFAGQLIANTMGLSYAMTIDPVRGVDTPAVGQIYSIFVLLVFFALNGHLRVIEVLADSFRTLPLGAAGLGRECLWQAVIWGGNLFSGAVLIALPAMTALLIVQLAMGTISRTAPALNLMAVGFPVTVTFGLVVLVAAVPTLGGAFERLLDDGFSVLRVMLRGGV